MNLGNRNIIYPITGYFQNPHWARLSVMVRDERRSLLSLPRDQEKKGDPAQPVQEA